MLLIFHNLKELSFGQLMTVYLEGNQENGREFWPQETPERQLALAEQDFYDYLRYTFFRAPGAFYAVWEEQGVYVSALRMEPWKDGFLLQALETSPGWRKQGYAKKLIQAVLDRLEPGAVYSHIHRGNTASFRTHEACGFRKVLDHAVYADGSVHSHSVTLKIDIR